MPESVKRQCSVRDGRFVEPCFVLDKAIDNRVGGFSKAKVIFITHLTNTLTGQPSRSFIGIKTKEYPRGMLFNRCPFCGEDISAPFQPDADDEPVAAPAG